MLGRYLGASALALAVDVAVLAACVGATSLSAGVSAGIGYGAGALAHYALSRRYVFAPGWLERRRLTELAAFIATGLCGLASTVGAVRILSDGFAVTLSISKAVAVAFSFILVYLLRRSIVFRSAAPEIGRVPR